MHFYKWISKLLIDWFLGIVMFLHKFDLCSNFSTCMTSWRQWSHGRRHQRKLIVNWMKWPPNRQRLCASWPNRWEPALLRQANSSRKGLQHAKDRCVLEQMELTVDKQSLLMGIGGLGDWIDIWHRASYFSYEKSMSWKMFTQHFFNVMFILNMLCDMYAFVIHFCIW